MHSGVALLGLYWLLLVETVLVDAMATCGRWPHCLWQYQRNACALLLVSCLLALLRWEALLAEARAARQPRRRQRRCVVWPQRPCTAAAAA